MDDVHAEFADYVWHHIALHVTRPVYFHSMCRAKTTGKPFSMFTTQDELELRCDQSFALINRCALSLLGAASINHLLLPHLNLCELVESHGPRVHPLPCARAAAYVLPDGSRHTHQVEW